MLRVWWPTWAPLIASDRPTGSLFLSLTLCSLSVCRHLARRLVLQHVTRGRMAHIQERGRPVRLCHSGARPQRPATSTGGGEALVTTKYRATRQPPPEELDSSSCSRDWSDNRCLHPSRCVLVDCNPADTSTSSQPVVEAVRTLEDRHRQRQSGQSRHSL